MVLDQAEFKQKAEEKKMSMSKNIARLAVTAGLTAALSFGGVMAPVTMAFAEGTSGSITINQLAGNETTAFKAYQIFKADVAEGESDKVVSNVKWADGLNEAAQTDIIAAVRADSKGSELPENPTAQNVADWLAKNVSGTTSSTRVDKTHVLNKIAKAIKSNGVTAKGMVQPGIAYAPDSKGYYLFLTDESTLATSDVAKKNTGTSPIFAIVGGSPVEVTEKTSIPTVEKQILDDTKGKTADKASTDDWKNVGDAWIGQVIDYKLTGTVADNIPSYDKYQYVFQDHLSVGLKADEASIVVTINGKKIDKSGNYYTATVTGTTDDLNNKTGQDLKVSFDDLKAAANSVNETLDGTSKVVVTYQAQLTSDAEYTAAGNTNDVKLVYSNNPMVDGTGTSTSKRVTDHVFRLDVTKVEKDNPDQKLEATFKVKMTKEGDTQLTTGRWLTQTGGITDKEEDAGKFTTNKDTGEIYIPGLVEGTYEITECNTPAGYNTLAPFTITVKPTYDDDGNLTNLAVTSSDTEMVTPKNASGATIPVTIQNKKGSGLPLTGLNGVTFTWIAGGAVLCIGVAHLIRSRKQAEESEQE